jgi:hypothetical protein
MVDASDDAAPLEPRKIRRTLSNSAKLVRRPDEASKGRWNKETGDAGHDVRDRHRAWCGEHRRLDDIDRTSSIWYNAPVCMMADAQGGARMSKTRAWTIVIVLTLVVFGATEFFLTRQTLAQWATNDAESMRLCLEGNSSPDYCRDMYGHHSNRNEQAMGAVIIYALYAVIALWVILAGVFLIRRRRTSEEG